MHITSILLDKACEVASETGADGIVVYADAFQSRQQLERFLTEKKPRNLYLVTRDKQDTRPTPQTHVIQVPSVSLTRMGQIKMALLLGFSRNYFKKGDKLVCLAGIAKSGVLDSLVFMEIGEEFEIIAASGGEDIGDCAEAEVFSKVLEIATKLASQGREGKPVGTIFVIGDTRKVQELSEQLILNPFQGYPEEKRNVLDPMIEETIKEFSSIDGAFIITREGIVESAGAYLKPTFSGEELPQGLGARHKAAAGITASTEAIAITVSESTGTVTIFKEGRIVMEIEKPHQIGAPTEASRMFFERAAQ